MCRPPLWRGDAIHPDGGTLRALEGSRKARSRWETLVPSPPPADNRDAAAQSDAEASRLVGELLTIPAHDLKTPLTIIRGNAQLLVRLAQRLDLADGERERLLTGLARIDAAVVGAVERIEQAQAVLRQTAGPDGSGPDERSVSEGSGGTDQIVDGP